MALKDTFGSLTGTLTRVVKLPVRVAASLIAKASPSRSQEDVVVSRGPSGPAAPGPVKAHGDPVAPAKKASAPAKKAPAKKAPVKKAPVKKAPAAKKTAAKKSAASKPVTPADVAGSMGTQLDEGTPTPS